MEQKTLVERPSLSLARIYGASPEKVWRAWTDPEALKQRWNLADVPGWRAELDVRVGGEYRGVYREVIPYRKLVFTWTVPHSMPELPRLDGESLVTVILRPLDGGGTELEFRQEPMFDESARGGWNGALDRLAQLLRETT